jgi:hypothetical protein
MRSLVVLKTYICHKCYVSLSPSDIVSLHRLTMVKLSKAEHAAKCEEVYEDYLREWVKLANSGESKDEIREIIGFYPQMVVIHRYPSGSKNPNVMGEKETGHMFRFFSPVKEDFVIWGLFL